MIWVVLGVIPVQMVGVVGLVTVLNGGVERMAPIAVCLALIVVPILFGIALRSELKGRRKG